MKKILPLVILLLVLLGVYFIFLRPQAPDNEFHITEPDKVGRIELEKVVKGVSKATLNLQKEEDHWLVDGKHIAVQPKVEEFLTMLSQIRVAQPMDGKAAEGALSALKLNHTRIRILDGQGNAMKEYLVGATNQQQTTNIMLLDGASRPYLVNRPGVVGYVSVMYNTDPLEWRERLLWDLKPEDLQEVSATYDSLTPGFSIRRTSPDAAWTLADGTPLNPEIAQAYTAQFQGKVHAESFAEIANPGLLDSLQRRQPDVRFSYKTWEGKSDQLRLFIRPENLNNYFGYMESRPEAYTVQHHVIDKYLRTAGYFVAALSSK